MAKNILIFSLAYKPLIGGAEIALEEITKRLKNINFTLITLQFDDNVSKYEAVDNFIIHRVGRVFHNRQFRVLNKLLFPLSAYLKARQLERTNRFDAIWSMMASYAGFASLFFKLQKPRLPYILSLQEGTPLDAIKRKMLIVYPLFKLIFKKADIIQTISNHLAKFAIKMGGYQVVVIPNGVDIKLFGVRPEEKRLEMRREKIGMMKGDYWIITVSRLSKKNAVADVILALPYLKRDIKLLIVGDGEQSDHLKELVAKSGLTYRVKFIGSEKYEKIPEYLHISNIFIRPSLSEGFGNSFIEAMAAGLPVIATSVGGIADFLIDRQTGLFCQVENPRSIADTVQILLNDDKLRMDIVKRAQAMVRNKYTWDKVAKEMEDKVFSIINTEL